jgi:putative glutamine amidotransferase
MSKSPTVGITVSIDEGKIIRAQREYLYIKRAYSKIVSDVGGNPILISPDLDIEVAAALCDGLVISGGDDIPPELYGESAHLMINPESTERIKWERELVQIFHDADKPVLGVCYGMQLINVHFGGTLCQDLASGVDHSGLNHGGMGVTTSHLLTIFEDSSLFPVLGASVRVSSAHHQAIRDVAPGFKISAVSEDGVIEAIEKGGILAVEWHPESDETGPAVYSRLLDLVRSTR